MESTERDQDHSPVMTNAAIRLRELLADVLQVKQGPTWVAFARAFGIPHKDPSEMEASLLTVASALPLMIRDLDRIRSRLSPQGYPDELLNEPIMQLKNALLACAQNLSADFSNERTKFRPDLMQSLGFWGHTLPKDEPQLSTIDLRNLWAELGTAKDAILNDGSLDRAFKDIMLDLIEQLEKALSAYAMGGVADVRSALRAFSMAAFAARADIQKHAKAESVQQGLAALRHVWKATKVAVNVKEVVELFQLVHEHASPTIAAALEWMK